MAVFFNNHSLSVCLYKNNCPFLYINLLHPYQSVDKQKPQKKKKIRIHKLVEKPVFLFFLLLNIYRIKALLCWHGHRIWAQILSNALQR